ncbi:sugar ABC transporter ATP-binding protein [Caballeronia sordidicola]|jgi:ABC-type sugar transport system ATPase subunit|uniref:Ribose ABC transport system, ATP-binding protein RbsA n=1 Tax=Caballeronia sordidicola TaxID=196367 RepID=A0A242N5G0_CABSO|nr:sugar ABC transporter ATP-binding protein [Caballeronia sordidicola]OTP78887.1 Ribose ABC transport system, ATP-binding protein RbsA [Caballeronia sordidicola]
MAFAETDRAVIAQLSDITKHFGAVKALNGCHLTLKRGEVHALIGVNGAGKSTLSRVVAGHIAKTSGSYAFNGEQALFASPRMALAAGISIVMQETSIAPDMTVLENIALAEFGARGRADWRAMERKAAAALDFIEQPRAMLSKRAGDLSIAQRQIIEICKALYNDSELIIFDEPTASFSPLEVEQLFSVMRLLRERAKSMVFVSHRLEEILEITDMVTVMRDGSTVAAGVPTQSITSRDLVQLMVGRDIQNVYDRTLAPAVRGGASSPLLDVRHLAAAPLVHDLSFTLHRGEIVALAGLVGAGRSEALEAIFGLRKMQGGELFLNGRALKPTSPIDAIRAGLGMIGEDRRRQGIVPDLSVEENLLLAHLGRSKAVHTDYGKQTAKVDALLRELDMPAHTRDVPMLALSGGQQQKILLARWLMLNPSVLLLDEPTRGVDIGARSTLYRIIRKVAESGVGVIVVSSDFEEALGLCDRIVVMSDGVSVAEVPSNVLDPAILTMLSMPRSSARQMKGVLEDVSKAVDATAFWVQVEGGRAFCLDLVEPRPLALGIAPNRFPLVDDTALRVLLAPDAADGAVIHDGAITSVKYRLTNASGHAFGEIGISMPSPGDDRLERSASAIAQSLLKHDIAHIRLAADPTGHQETVHEQ